MELKCIYIGHVEKYERLVSGEAEAEVQSFLSGEHDLPDYKAKIQHYIELDQEISGLDDVLLFHMFHLECHDIKHGLIELVQGLISSLVQDLAEKHSKENARYVCSMKSRKNCNQ